MIAGASRGRTEEAPQEMSRSQPGPEFPSAHVTHVKLRQALVLSHRCFPRCRGAMRNCTLPLHSTSSLAGLPSLRPITIYAEPCYQHMDVRSCLCHLLHCIFLEKVKLKIKHRFGAFSLKNAQHFRSLAQSVQN